MAGEEGGKRGKSEIFHSDTVTLMELRNKRTDTMKSIILTNVKLLTLDVEIKLKKEYPAKTK